MKWYYAKKMHKNKSEIEKIAYCVLKMKMVKWLEHFERKD